MRFAIGAVCVGFVWPLAFGQNVAPFEVASVKVHADKANTNVDIGPSPGGGLSCTNASLRSLISYAWDVRDYQVLNAPTWAETERYDIAAKLSGEDAAREPPFLSGAGMEFSRLRTQELLAERFGLLLREEQREMPVYALVVTKNGPKLQRSTSTRPLPMLSSNPRSATCRKVTMARFAAVLLSRLMSRAVIDETGLNGEWDFDLKFEPEDPAQPGANVARALEEQLGLKLETARGKVSFWRVERAEKPGAN